MEKLVFNSSKLSAIYITRLQPLTGGRYNAEEGGQVPNNSLNALYVNDCNSLQKVAYYMGLILTTDSPVLSILNIPNHNMLHE